jgi:hypothetical protein
MAALVLDVRGVVHNPAGRFRAATRALVGRPVSIPDILDDPQSAPAIVTRRFLAAHGPATHHDLARWWNGGGVTTARQWIASLGEEVSSVDLDGAQSWMLTAHAREVREVPLNRSVRLLPGFDQYVVGASCHAEHLLPGDLRRRVDRPQGWISPVLLVNGRMEGTWRHEIKGSRVEVVIEPFVKLPVWVRRAAGQEAERLAAFLGGTLRLAFKDDPREKTGSSRVWTFGLDIIAKRPTRRQSPQ